MTQEWHFQLKSKLGPIPSDPPGGREQSAVSLILKPHQETGGPEIVFIKRAERSDDPWSGHMAFPGGRRHREDQSIVQTAIRETYEEIGLQLSGHEALGAMAAYSPKVSPGLSVHPHLFFIHDVPSLKLDSKEVEEVHWVPVEQAFDSSAFTQRPHTFRGMTLSLPSFSFDIKDRHIWGVTYVIFLDFLYALAETDWGQQLCRERNFTPKEIWEYRPYR